MIDPRLLEIIVCPSCHSRLRPEPDEIAATRLACTGDDCALVYAVREGVPVLLVDEAVSVAEHPVDPPRDEDERAD